MNLDLRSLAIEIQSARNAVYSSLSEETVLSEDAEVRKQINKAIYNAYKSCKDLEKHVIKQSENK